MPKRRESETDETREWVGDVAAAKDLDDGREWVVWGVSTPPERAADPTMVPERPGEPGNDIARRIAQGHDPEWAESRDPGKWIVIRRASENEVDEWTLDDETVRGYAPYLVNPDDAAAKPELLRGVLRGDVVRRRKPKRFDAARPE